jgi:hypothetical protein
MRARSVWLAGITVVGVLLGGCADGDAPASLPTRNGSGLAIASPPPEPPATQAAPEDSLESELQHFVSRYISASNRSWFSREALDERRGYFADSCESCHHGWQMARDALEAGNSLEGEPVSAVVLGIDESQGDLVTLRTQIESPAAVVKDAGGAVVQEFEYTRTTTIYRMSRQSSGRWLIIDDEVLAS